MENRKGPIIVIAVTILLAVGIFLFFDNSGMSVTDINLEQDDSAYNLTYYVRLGRNFNELNCVCIFYDQNGNVITNTSSILKDVYPGTHTISSQINLTEYENNTDSNSLKIESLEIRIYDNYLNSKEGQSNNQKPVYIKTFDVTK